MGFVSRHARAGGEEKKGGGKKFRSIRLYSFNSLTQLWLLNVVKKDRGAQNFRVSQSSMLFYY